MLATEAEVADTNKLINRPLQITGACPTGVISGCSG